MHSLLGTSKDHYEVLGLPRSASSEEIDKAFNWLIRQNGYCYDVPVHQRPQRVFEIKQAYAMLRDPAKRSVYDRSLCSAPVASRPLKTVPKESSIIGAGTRVSTGTDALIPSAEGRQRQTAARRTPGQGRSCVGAPVVVAADSPRSTVAPDATESGTAKPATMPEEGGRIQSQPAVEKPGPTRGADSAGLEEPQARGGLFGPSTINAHSPDHARSPLGGDYSASRYRRANWAKNWGVGAAVTLGLGVLMFASWSRDEPQASPTGPLSTSPGATGDQSAVASLTGSPPASEETHAEAPEALNPAEIAAALADGDAALASLRGWIGSGVSAPSEVITGPEVDSAAIAGQQARSPLASALSTNGPASDAELGSPAPVSTAPESRQAIASRSVAASALSPGPITTSNASPLVTQQPIARATGSPAQWISGGPTDGDNRRNRFHGAVVVQFTVGTDGRVANCFATQSSGNPKLDAMTCHILVERGRFSPARNAQGQPVAGQVHGTYAWNRGRRQKN
jgi:TonB family protein